MKPCHLHVLLLALVLFPFSSHVPYSRANGPSDLLAQAAPSQPHPPYSLTSDVNLTVPTIGPRVDFDWRMQERFGVDLDGRRVIDRPVPIRNTRSFVFNVREGEPIPARPEFIVEFDAKKGIVGNPVLLRQTNQGARIQFRWTVSGNPDAGNPVHKRVEVTEPVTQLRLPEGRYRANLQVLAPGFEGGSQQDIRVRDIVIVALGDSYSSGEGNPESSDTIQIDSAEDVIRMGLNTHPLIFRHMVTTPVGSLGITHRTVRWADDGLAEASSRPEPGTRHISFFSPIIGGHYFQLHESRSRVGEEHIRAHRSSKSWPAMAALALERADDHSSVTFIHLAASGATIKKGLLGGYAGTSGEHLQGQVMLPQVEQMRDLLAGRTIDVVTLSVGGNDVGFSHAVVSLVSLHTPGLGRHASSHPLTFGDIERAFKDGNWRAVKDDIEFLGLLPVGIRDPWERNLAGTSFLPSEYARLALKLWNSGVKAIWMTTYPNLLWRLNSNSQPELCDILLKLQVGPLNNIPVEIDHTEIRWANEHLAAPLNDLLLSLPRDLELPSLATATPHPMVWMVDGGIFGEARRGGRGACAGRPPNYPTPNAQNDLTPHAWRPAAASVQGHYPELRAGTRWFRTHHESLRIQGGKDLTETTGILHPNEYGHWAIAKRMLSSVPLPVPIRIPDIREPLLIGE